MPWLRLNTCIKWRLTTVDLYTFGRMLEVWLETLESKCHLLCSGILRFPTTSTYTSFSYWSTSTSPLRLTITRMTFTYQKIQAKKSVVTPTFTNFKVRSCKRNTLYKYIEVHLVMWTLYTLTSVYIFSILFLIHFQGADKENLFINQELL